MSNELIITDDPESRPAYAGWRAELLTELALARVPGLIVNKRPARPGSGLDFDFLVATEKGACFFIEVKSFSYLRAKVARTPKGQWRALLSEKLLRDVEACRSPFFLFVFDVDTEEGRYLRLDGLASSRPADGKVTVHLPETSRITRENLESLIASLEREHLGKH